MQFYIYCYLYYTLLFPSTYLWKKSATFNSIKANNNKFQCNLRSNHNNNNCSNVRLIDYSTNKLILKTLPKPPNLNCSTKYQTEPTLRTQVQAERQSLKRKNQNNSLWKRRKILISFLVTGHLQKTKTIIGFCRSTTATSWIAPWEEWTAFLPVWRSSLALEKLSNVAAIIKRCKRSTNPSQKSSSVSEKFITIQRMIRQ